MTSRAHERIARAPEAAGDDRRVARLLSALAEAPDYGSAAVFLLDELSQLAGGAPAAILRYVPATESLAVIESIGLAPADRKELPVAIEDRDHPLMIATLSLTPMIREADRVARPGRVGPVHSWTALPLPQPHYRGAPALLKGADLTARLEQAGARLVPLRERGFNTAPAGVVLVGAVLDEAGDVGVGVRTQSDRVVAEFGEHALILTDRPRKRPALARAFTSSGTGIRTPNFCSRGRRVAVTPSRKGRRKG